MRTSALLLACLFTQDVPEPRQSFAFTVEQGWSLTTDAEGDFPEIREADLQEGITPRFRPPLTRPTFQTPDRDTRPRARGSGARGARMTRTSKDPVKLEGSFVLLPDGACLIQFSRVEYWDRTQRYWIEFQPEKIRTFGLGGVEKWTGSREAWAARLEKLETAFLDAYLKVLTPQPAAPAPDKLGLDGASASEPAWRLFVATSLEEQLAALLLARLDGAKIERTSWPAGTSRYPERPLLVARALIDRLLAQAAGTFAPEPARTRPGRTLKDQAWLGTEIAVPSMAWMDGRAWSTERLKPIEDARGRLRTLAEEIEKPEFRRSGFADVDAWRAAVVDEAKSLRKQVVVAVGPGDALVPRTRAAGPATYDFREKCELRDGVVQSSDAEVRGTAHDIDLFFFHSGQNAWKENFVKLETWYKAKVRRE